MGDVFQLPCAEVDKVEGELKAGLKGLDAKIDSRFDGLQHTINGLQSTLMLTGGAIIATLIAGTILLLGLLLLVRLAADGARPFDWIVLALRDQVAPPTINYENPDPDCDLDYVPNTARPMKLDAVLSNSFGFGGTNGTLILRKLT